MPKSKKSAAARSQRYPEKRHRAKEIVTKFVQPNTLQDINKTQNIEFSFKSGTNEYVRFGELPFVMSYRLKHANPLYESGSPDADKKHAYYYLTTATTHKVWLQNTLGVTSFFKGCAVKIDGEDVGVNKLAGLTHAFTHLNRSFMKDEAFKSKYGKKMWRISNKNDLAIASKVEALKQAQLPLEFDNMTDPGIRTESFNPGDSIFPFYNQCNAVQALTGKTVTRGYFSPETRFGFHLEKCHPIDQAVEQLLNQDSQLFGGTLAVIPLSTGATKHTEATDRVKGIILEIIDIKLTYESFTPESLTGSPRQSVFYVDVPQVIVAELTPDVNVTDVTFTLPPGTKVVYIVYAHQEQLWHDAVSGKNTSCRFMFPKTLAKVTVDLEGR